MAITVSGTNPVLVTVVSTTATANTTFPANAGTGTDRSYVFADNIVGTVNPALLVVGFGLSLQTTLAGGGVSLTNNGFVNISQTVSAVELVGNGGAVTYIGNGPITNNADTALEINNTGAGTVTATINNNVTSNAAQAVEIQCGTGLLTLTQNAGSFITANAIANAITLAVHVGWRYRRQHQRYHHRRCGGRLARVHQHRGHDGKLHRDHHCRVMRGSIAPPARARSPTTLPATSTPAATRWNWRAPAPACARSM